MSEENEALVRRLFEEVWNEGNLNAAEEIIHEDYYSPEGPFWIGTGLAEAGLQTLEEEMKSYREVYSDLRFEIERTFSEEDVVIATWRASGIAKHEFFITRAGQEANKELRAEGISLSRIADGKITETRLYWPRHPLSPP